MKPILLLILLILPAACSDQLENKTQTVRLQYIAWGCDCANWARPADIEKYADEGDTLASLSVFIEPADTSLVLADTLCYNGDIIEFTGQFYHRKGFPKGYKSSEPVDKASIFRYTKYKVIRPSF